VRAEFSSHVVAKHSPTYVSIVASGYALFALLVARATAATTTRSLLAVVAIVALYGLTIEGRQMSVATRQFSLLDALANATGASVAIVGRQLIRLAVRP